MKILFLSDTHLGFDLPFRPRVKRRRRGPDFFKMFELALESAHRGEVDAVVHGGDILFRSKVPPQLVRMAFEPLLELAAKGMPVYVVPGNHERSHIPYRLLASHPNINIFVRPKTFYLEVDGFVLALAGFPYVRDNVRGSFKDVLAQTCWQEKPFDAAVLCIHHCVEGSAIKMGERMYVFRGNSDVIRIREFPPEFAAVLSGHIHRFQVLTSDLRGDPAPAPVFYPGSTERTSFVEKDEAKGYIILEIGAGLEQWTFHELPARPMYRLELEAANLSGAAVTAWVRANLDRLPDDSVVQLRLRGVLSADALNAVSAAALREMAPETMNLSLSLPGMRGITSR
jgi:DNA repair exonuclease SbcCD nuclease subunit